MSGKKLYICGFPIPKPHMLSGEKIEHPPPHGYCACLAFQANIFFGCLYLNPVRCPSIHLAASSGMISPAVAARA